MPAESIHFVTGRLAEKALRRVVEQLAAEVPFQYSIDVLPITVAALMTPAWIANRLNVPNNATRIILPGFCDGDLSPITNVVGVPVEIGPKDLRQLPEFFGRRPAPPSFDQWDIAIIAEINQAPRMTTAEILAIAEHYRRSGATLIDVGCEPGGNWNGVGECVKSLVGAGHRVSIDSLNPKEIGRAVAAGAELVLSVNGTNVDAVSDWGCEVVVIPDDIHDIASMDATVERLAMQNVPLRIDPILEPVGLGFAASLNRYYLARDRWPEAEIMMGIGNLTELSDVDSAGVNFLLLAICQELGIRSVLTTEVINYARSSVRECDLARRLVHYAVHESVPPKNLSDALVVLRDRKLLSYSDDEIKTLAANIKDHNYRIIADNGQINLMGDRQLWQSADPFELFDQLATSAPKNLDPSHAFYLGYEMCKAELANQLGKNYSQDETLDWGHLTVSEPNRHRLRKTANIRKADLS